MRQHQIGLELAEKSFSSKVSRQLLAFLYDTANATLEGKVSDSIAQQELRSTCIDLIQADGFTSARALDLTQGVFVKLTKRTNQPSVFLEVGQLAVIEGIAANGQQGIKSW